MRQQVTNAQAQLAAARDEINTAGARINDFEHDLEEAYQQLGERQQQANTSRARISDLEQQLAAANQQLANRQPQEQQEQQQANTALEHRKCSSNSPLFLSLELIANLNRACRSSYPRLPPQEGREEEKGEVEERRREETARSRAARKRSARECAGRRWLFNLSCSRRSSCSSPGTGSSSSASTTAPARSGNSTQQSW